MDGVSKVAVLLVLLSLTVKSVSANEPITPVNTAVKAGDRAVLECSWDEIPGLPITWYEMITIGSERLLSVNGVKDVSHPWRNNPDISHEDQYNLIIDPANVGYAGTYRCDITVLDGEYENNYAELIVTYSPICSTQSVMKQEVILEENVPSKFICTQRYTGAWGPELEWPDRIVSDPLENSPGRVQREGTLSPEMQDDGMIFTCSSAFAAPSVGTLPPNYDQSTPDLTDSCQIHVEVQYGPKNLVITPVMSKPWYSAGDVFVCSADGNPAVNLTWDVVYGSPGNLIVNGDKLEILNEENMLYNVSCEASNQMTEGSGDIKTQFTYYEFYVGPFETPSTGRPMTTPEQSSTTDSGVHSSADNTGAIVGGVVGVILIAFIIIGICILRKKQQKKAEDAQRMTPWSSRRDRPDSEDVEMNNSGSSVERHKSDGNNYIKNPNNPLEGIDNLAGPSSSPLQNEIREKLKKYEIARANVELSKVLGEGHFGQVWLADVWKLGDNKGSTTSAVKSLKANASDKDKTDLINELDVMSSLPPHRNVVALLACVTDRDPIMMLVEYMANGNLKDYLRLQRSSHIYGNLTEGSSSLTARELLLYAYQVASGMAHIAKHNLLHRDLAARNILIGENNLCKVSDFGFARDVIDSHIYHRQSEGPLPIRWMAPESIFDNEYTTKSDVWSYGVLLWEIVTLGASPYPGMSGKQVMTQVKRGYRMDKPDHCAQEVYQFMTNCWQNADQRPSFEELTLQIDALLQEESDYMELELYHEDLYGDLDSGNVTDEKV